MIIAIAEVVTVRNEIRCSGYTWVLFCHYSTLKQVLMLRGINKKFH